MLQNNKGAFCDTRYDWASRGPTGLLGERGTVSPAGYYEP
jgi:hypothetical protein